MKLVSVKVLCYTIHPLTIYLSILPSLPMKTGCAPNYQLKHINTTIRGFCALILQHVCCEAPPPPPGGLGRKMNMSDVKKV